MATANVAEPLEDLEQPFRALGSDDQLAVLWHVYTTLGETRLENPDDNKESDNSSDLYNQLKGKSKDEQLQFMRDVLAGESNNSTNAYSQLSDTTKIALWYRLGEGMSEGNVIQVPSDYSLSDDAQKVVDAVSAVSFEQKYIFMRDVIVGDRN